MPLRLCGYYLHKMKAILFDIDGTLLKCHGAGKASLMEATMDVFGTVGSMEVLNFQGKTDHIILRESLLAHGITEDQINGSLRKLKERYFNHLRENIHVCDAEIMPGIEPLLRRLAGQHSVITGLLTGNFFESARIKLGRVNLEGYFAFGVFSDDIPDRNMMPHEAREILKKEHGLDVDFRDMIIIGDTIHDIDCANGAGAVSVAVGTGWQEKEVLLGHNPDHYFDDLSDTETVIKSILN